MPAQHVMTTGGETITLEEATLDNFKTGLRGELLYPDHNGYEQRRHVWNGMIDRYPALIARCQGVADVVAAVNFARQNELLLSVRGGGHNVAGSAVCDGGLMIDLSLMRGIWVDPDKRTVRVQGGATWGDVDRESQLFGLATPGGIISTTGVAGLTLGGGYGYLRKKYGLSCDNLLSVELVTANGQVVHASDEENRELFWGVRGGGGNFGIVTSFEFRLHAIGPSVLHLLVLYPAEKSKEIWRTCFDYMATAPDELSIIALIFAVPPVPPFPEHLHGKHVLVLSGIYAGPVEEGKAIIEPLRHLDTPVLDFTDTRPYTAVQRMSDPRYPSGHLYYWKSRYLNSLDDEVLDEIVTWALRRPSPRSFVNIWHMGGAIDRIGLSETAFSHRNVPYLLEISSNWSDPAQSEANIAWTRAFWSAMQRFSSGATYVNFPGFGEEGEALVRSAYGTNYDRLVALKSQVDPNNLFRMNQNIKPVRAERADARATGS
jgi:FAD/FMN-containing dehydrogenase